MISMQDSKGWGMTEDLKFYTTRQVSQILQKDIATIRRYIKEGKFPETKFIGKGHLISQDSLIKFLNKHSPQKFAERSA